MERSELNRRNAETVRRWFRILDDRDGVPPDGMLAELAATAGEHAADAVPRRPARKAAT